MTETELYERFEDLARRIGEINRKVDFILSELKLDYAQPESSEVDEIRKLLRANQKIEAIKVYREHHKASLSEAKDAVEQIEKGSFNT